MKRIILASALILTGLLSDFYNSENAQAIAPPNDLVVHEWGTFTSIAGKNGTAIDWRPLGDASDLPSFVYNDTEKEGFRGTYRDPGKGRLARVRMETPVIYFYTAKEMEVSVNVDFPQGRITEWYPQASVVNAEYGGAGRGRFESGINWGTIKLLPNEQPNFLREIAFSHYYPARATDAVAVQVCNADKTGIETEKFLFYRGIGDFGLPLSAKIDGNSLTLKDSGGGGEIRKLIVFENRSGRIGFKLIDSISNETVVTRPETNRNLIEVLPELEKILISEGLYDREAKSMIETWKDSWFEEGLRVFYILSRESTDKILPLKVAPEPRETVRVMVGRAEIITPEMENDVRRQVGFLRSNSKQMRERAQENLKKYGRFYEPVLKSILETEKDEKVRAQIRKLIEISVSTEIG